MKLLKSPYVIIFLVLMIKGPFFYLHQPQTQAGTILAVRIKNAKQIPHRRRRKSKTKRKPFCHSCFPAFEAPGLPWSGYLVLPAVAHL